MGGTMNKTETTDNLTVSYMHKLHRWRMAFFGVVILLAGIVIGGASMLILMPHKLMKPPRGPESESMRIISQLQRDLDLSHAQSEKMKPIMSRHMEKLHKIRTDARFEIDQALVQMNEDISAILTEKQKQNWQRRLDRLQRDLRPGGPRRGNGFGEPRRGQQQERFRRGQQEHMRRGPGPFGPQRPAGPNSPRRSMEPAPRRPDERPRN